MKSIFGKDGFILVCLQYSRESEGFIADIIILYKGCAYDCSNMELLDVGAEV